MGRRRSDRGDIARRAARSFVLSGAAGAAREVAPDAAAAGRRALWPVAATVAAIGAGLVTAKVVDLAWTVLGPAEPGSDGHDHDAAEGPGAGARRGRAVVTWSVALVTGVTVGGLVGRRLTAAPRT